MPLFFLGKGVPPPNLLLSPLSADLKADFQSDFHLCVSSPGVGGRQLR